MMQNVSAALFRCGVRKDTANNGGDLIDTARPIMTFGASTEFQVGRAVCAVENGSWRTVIP